MSALATFIHNPFDLTDRDDVKLSIETYRTIEDVIGPLADPPTADARIHASVNGRLVEREQWSEYQLQDDDHMVVKPKVEFGIVAAVAQIVGALATALPAASTPIIGNIVTWGTVYKLGFMVAGGYLMRALAPKPKMPDFNTERASSQVYGAVSQTLQRAGVPIPLYFGKCRVRGNVVSAHTYLADGETRYGRCVVAFGEGPIQGFVANSGYLDSQPLSRYDTVSFETKRGTFNQSAASLFTQVKPEYMFNDEVTYAQSVTRTVPSSLADDLEFTIHFPRGLFYLNDEGSTATHGVGVRVSIRTQGAATWHVLAEESVQAATTSAYRKTYLASGSYTGGTPFTCQRGTKYEVKIDKTTADQTTTRYGDDLYLEAIREVLNDGFVYPGIAYAAIEGLELSKLSGGLDVSFITENLVVPVWTGSAWTIQYSNNPAWIIYYLLTLPLIDGDGSVENPYTIVAYRGLQPSQVDLAKIYELAAYCDQLVPDGNGGTEKRIEINRGFDVRTTIWEAVQEVCQVSRCVPVIIGDKVSVAINKPKSASQLFTVDNTNLGGFRRQWLPIDNRVTEFEITFANEAKDYEDDTIPLLDSQADATEWNKATLRLIGVTRESQAWREALIRLNMNRLQKCAVELDVDIESLACTVGDVIKIQSRVPIWGEGVTVVSATASTVTLSAAPASVTASDQICIRTIDTVNEKEVVEVFDVASVSGATVTIDGSWANTPTEGNIGFYGESKYVTKNFLVYNLERRTNLEATIHAVDYYSDIYTDDVETPTLGLGDYVAPTVDEKPIIRAPTQNDIDTAAGNTTTITTEVDADFPILSGGTWTSNSPSAGYAKWSAMNLLYKGTDYSIVEGNTNLPYVYWDVNSYNTTFKATASLGDTVGEGRFLIGINEAGTLRRVLPGSPVNVDHVLDGDSYQRFSVAEAAKLLGIESGATVGATWDGNISGQPSNLYQIFYADTAPTSGMVSGDYWIDTNDGNKLHRYDGSSWVEIQDADIAQALTDAATAQATADGKIQTYFQASAPSSGMGTGDIWFDTDADNKPYRYDGSCWVAADYDVATWSKIVGAGKPEDGADQTSLHAGDINWVGDTPPPNPQNGWNWFDTSVTPSALKRWNGSSWVTTSTVGSAWSQVVDDNGARPADHADVTAPSIAIKINHVTYSSPGDGEAVIHGFDANGDPSAVDGYIVFNGQKITVPRNPGGGYTLATGFAGTGYLVFDTTCSGKFVITNGTGMDVAFARKIGGQWYYDDNGGLTSGSWVNFTPAATDAVIGTCVCDAGDHIADAHVWPYGMSCDVVPESGADKTGDKLTSMGGLLPNWNCDIEDGSGKPAGILVTATANADRRGLSWGDTTKTFMRIGGASESDVMVGFPAIPIDDKQKYQVTIRHKSADTINWLYLRFYELASALPQGCTHVGGSDMGGVVAPNTTVIQLYGGTHISTSWQESTYTYTPTPGTKCASFSILNWANAHANPYDVDSVQMVPIPKTAAEIEESTDRKWAAESGADVTADNPISTFRETFEDPNGDAISRRWDAGEPENLAIVSGEGIAGAKILRATDRADIQYFRMIPFDPSKLYRIRCRVRTTAGTGKLYLGMQAFTVSGAGNMPAGYTAYWFCAFGVSVPGQWTEYTGYFKGTSPSADGATHPTADDPGAFLDGTAYIRPFAHLNYNTTGVTDVDEISIDILPDGADEIIESGTKKWAAETGADVTADHPVSTFRDTFENPLGDIESRYIGLTGNDYSIVSGEGLAGGKLLRVGNNSGDDMCWTIYHRSIPYDPGKLYRLKIRIRRTAGTGSVYFGFCGRDATDTAYVNKTGDDNTSNAHYTTIPLSTEWQTTTFYFKGHKHAGFSGDAPSSNPDAPAEVHADVRYVRPCLLMNYPNAAGIIEIDELTLDIVSEESDWTNVYGSGKPTDNADVTAPSIAIRANHISFASANDGEAYIHGFDADGNPADADGYIVYQGQKITVPRAETGHWTVATELVGSGYIVFDTTKSGKFTVSSLSVSVAFAKREGGQWFYDNHGSWVNFVPAATDAVIGTVVCDRSDHIKDAHVWPYGLSCDVVAEAGADKTGSNMTRMNGLLPNWNCDIEDAEDKPAGWLGVENTTSRKYLTWMDADKTAARIDGLNEDDAVAYGFPAIPIDDKQKYLVTVRHKSSHADVGAIYFRWNERASVLPQGCTHVGYGVGGAVAERDTKQDLLSHANHMSTTWVESTYTYAPTAGTKFASFAVYNWSAKSHSIDIDSVQVYPIAKTAAEIDESTDRKWAGESGADVTANNPINTFRETFEDPHNDYLTRWEKMHSTPTSIEFGGLAGGKFLRMGDNNADSDSLGVVYFRSIPFDPSKLYRIRVRARASAGSPKLYVGISGRDATDTTWVDSHGGVGNNGCHFIGAHNEIVPAEWTVYTGYFMGHAATGTDDTHCDDPANPGQLHDNVRYFRPLVYSYAPDGGHMDIDEVAIDVISEESDWSSVYGTGKPADNADVTGDHVGSMGGLLPNWNCDIEDREGKPAGIVPTYTTASDRRDIDWGDADKTFIAIGGGTDGSVMFGWPAIPIDDKQKYQITIRHKSSATTGNLYIRVYERNSVLPTGCTHVGDETQGEHVAHYDQSAYLYSGEHFATDWVESTYTYTPTPGAKMASFTILNWSATTRIHYTDFVQMIPIAKTAAEIDESTDRKWAGESGADVTANSPIEKLRENCENPHGDLLDRWVDPVYHSRCTIVSGGGVAGGKVLRCDARVTLDYYEGVVDKLIPFDPSKLYRMRIRVRRTSGTGLLYAGVRTYNAAGTSYVHMSGSSAYWFCTSGAAVPGQWTIYTGYLKGHTANGSHGGYTPDSPASLMTGAAYISPRIFVNYNTSGITEIDEITLEAIPDTEDSSWRHGSDTSKFDGANIYARTITANHIAAGAITANEIAAGTVTGDRIAGGTITGGLIAADAVLASHIAAGQISAGHLAVDAVTADKIASGVIATGHLAAGAVTAAKIASGTITGDLIAAGTITGGLIAGNTITADKLSVSSLSAVSANMGTITSGTIQLGLGGTNKLEIGGSGIRGSNDSGSTWYSIISTLNGEVVIKGDKIQADTITAEKIITGAVSEAHNAIQASWTNNPGSKSGLCSVATSQSTGYKKITATFSMKSSVNEELNVYLKRGSTTLKTWTKWCGSANFEDGVLTCMDTTMGSYTYSLSVVSVQYGWTLQNGEVIVEQFKK